MANGIAEGIVVLVHISNFKEVAGSEDFACATIRTNPFDFQGKIKNFVTLLLLKIRFKIAVTPLPKKSKVKITVFQ